jgi:hypothetical protein
MPSIPLDLMPAVAAKVALLVLVVSRPSMKFDPGSATTIPANPGHHSVPWAAPFLRCAACTPPVTVPRHSVCNKARGACHPAAKRAVVVQILVTTHHKNGFTAMWQRDFRGALHNNTFKAGGCGRTRAGQRVCVWVLKRRGAVTIVTALHGWTEDQDLELHRSREDPEATCCLLQASRRPNSLRGRLAWPRRPPRHPWAGSPDTSVK